MFYYLFFESKTTTIKNNKYFHINFILFLFAKTTQQRKEKHFFLCWIVRFGGVDVPFIQLLYYYFARLSNSQFNKKFLVLKLQQKRVSTSLKHPSCSSCYSTRHICLDQVCRLIRFLFDRYVVCVCSLRMRELVLASLGLRPL